MGSEAEMRRRVKARADAAISRRFAWRGVELALSTLPKDVADQLLCEMIVERCPEMFEDLPEPELAPSSGPLGTLVEPELAPSSGPWVGPVVVDPSMAPGDWRLENELRPTRVVPADSKGDLDQVVEWSRNCEWVNATADTPRRLFVAIEDASTLIEVIESDVTSISDTCQRLTSGDKDSLSLTQLTARWLVKALQAALDEQRRRRER